MPENQNRLHGARRIDGKTADFTVDSVEMQALLGDSGEACLSFDGCSAAFLFSYFSCGTCRELKKFPAACSQSNDRANSTE